MASRVPDSVAYRNACSTVRNANDPSARCNQSIPASRLGVGDTAVIAVPDADAAAPESTELSRELDDRPIGEDTRDGSRGIAAIACA